MTLMVCLVEWILGRMEKMRKENFLESVWLRERGGKIMVESKCFFLGSTKKFALQNEKKNG